MIEIILGITGAIILIPMIFYLLKILLQVLAFYIIIAIIGFIIEGVAQLQIRHNILG